MDANVGASSGTRSGSARLLFWTTAVTCAAAPLLAYRWPTPVGNISTGRITLLALCAVLVLCSRRLDPDGRGMLLVLATFPYLFACLIGLVITPEYAIGQRLVFRFLEGLATFLVVFRACRLLWEVDPRAVGSLPLIGFIPTGALGAFQALQSALGTTPTIPFIDYVSLAEGAENAARVEFSRGEHDFGVQRIAAATGDPPTFGIMCALVLVFAAWVLRVRGPRPYSLATLTAIPLAILGCVASSSVSSVIVLGVGLLGVSIERGQGPGLRSILRGRPLALAALIAVAWMVLVKFVPQVSRFWSTSKSRVTGSLEDSSQFQGHTDLLLGAWAIFADHPFFGVGIGAGSRYYFEESVGFSSFHNVYAQTGAELGLVGLVGMTVFLVALKRLCLPPSIFGALLAAWGVYLDWNRLPYVWALLACVAILYTSVQAQRRVSGLPAAPLVDSGAR